MNINQEKYSEYIKGVGKGETMKCRGFIVTCFTTVENRGENWNVFSWELVKQPMVHLLYKILCNHLNYNFEDIIIA